MDRMLDKVMDLAAEYQDLSRIEFPDRPEFDDRCIVFGRDQDAVRDLISRISLDDLSRGKNLLNVSGSGDFLTVDIGTTFNSNEKDKHLEELYRVITDLARRMEN
jgi:hypothetical protein